MSSYQFLQKSYHLVAVEAVDNLESTAEAEAVVAAEGNNCLVLAVGVVSNHQMDSCQSPYLHSN